MMTRRVISTYISALAISIVTLFPITAEAQEGRVGVPVKSDSIAFLRGIAVGVDAVGAAQNVFSDYGQYEAHLKVNLKDKYFPVIEIGVGQADHADDATGIGYKTSAPYGKIGCDFNVMKNKHDIYRVFVGVRYAFTSFKYDISGPTMTDPVWGGELPYEAKDVKGTYHWVEGLAGVDAKILGPLHLGWTVRYRSRLSQKAGEIGEPWYVPGFGRSGSSRIGATFNIVFEL